MIIVHYHLRPGGVRRVIELAAPYIVRKIKQADRIVIASGEQPDALWEKVIRKALAPLRVEFFIDASFGYLADQHGSIAQISRQTKCALAKLLNGVSGSRSVVWAHNLGIGRNLIVSNELAKACSRHKIPLLLHHHDWWFDNRWSHWPQMRRAGFPSLASTARAIFASGPQTQHIAINRADHQVLSRNLRRRSHWLPNLSERLPKPATTCVRKAQKWLCELVGQRRANIWLMPCRALRRKNIAEGILLMRWLRPDGWLVTTGGPSSANEQDYFQKLSMSVERYQWRVKLGALRGDESRKPPVNDLMAASEAIILTSIQEGFGLPFLEAAAVGRPLLARAIPNIAPDLSHFGFRFPQYYDDIAINPCLFNWGAEFARQRTRYNKWRDQLPDAVKKFVEAPFLLLSSERHAVPFSRLTLSAQLEILAKPADESYELCLRLNPFLKKWRKRAEDGALKPTQWPRGADQQLGGVAYGTHFAKIWAQCRNTEADRMHGPAAQRDFLRLKLKSRNLFPLLWSPKT